VAVALADGALAKGDPYSFFTALARDETVSPLNRAFAGFWLGNDLEAANASLRDAYHGAIGEEETLTPEVANAQFKWQMRTWVRIYYLFGPDGTRAKSALDAENTDRLETLLWHYGYAKSRVARADLAFVWFIQGSENHDMMDLGNAFLALQALAGKEPYATRTLSDGLPPSAHIAAWTPYYTRYCEERIRNGLFIEVASPTYGKYLIPELLNIAEFAVDNALRDVTTQLLHLTWADWAIEQLNGVRGGGKARCYQGNYSRRGHSDSWWQMGQYLLTEGPWTNTGISAHPIMGFNLCLASSPYELPEVVRALALNPEARGEYAYVSRRPAKMTSVETLPPLGEHGTRYAMAPKDSQLVRYSWCTPNYIMGSFLTDPTLCEGFAVDPEIPNENRAQYAAINAQNRWQGIVFDTDPDARIFPQCVGTPDKNKPGLSITYVQQVAVQHENVMIVQMNRANPKNTAMRVFFAEDMRDRIEEQDDWYLVEEGDSYAAAKLLNPVDGHEPADAEWSGGFLQPEDPYAAVILVAGRRTRFASRAEFMDYLLSHDCTVAVGTLTYRFTDSAGDSVDLGLALTEARIPVKNGAPIDLAPARTYDSPFVKSLHGNRGAHVAFDGATIELGATK
jgi:hypothetical protein